MREAIKKPYELSLWADLLVTSSTDESKSYYKEQKIATIGSDTMTAPNRAFDVVLTENINGEKTLTFSLRHKFYDDKLDELRDNPFLSYLTNERKVKLLYGDIWYDFIIKEIEETSEEYVFSYVAKDLFVLELSKVGYNVTFDKELNNNQGTIVELAEKTLEDTDWIVDKNNCDLLQQKVKEPLYKCKITQVEADLRVLNVETDETLAPGTIETDEIIYIFYSYIKNQNGVYIQFIRDKDKETITINGQEITRFNVDSEDVIISTNYRFLDEAKFVFDENNEISKITIGDTIITVEGTYNLNQAYRLVYSQKTTYDPVMGKTVSLYRASYEDAPQDVYSYIDYQYVTSNIVTSFITNGSDFDILEDSSIQGWSQYVPSATQTEGASIVPPLSITTYPQIKNTIDLSKIQNFANIRGFLELQFANGYDSKKGTDAYFNSGFEDNSGTLDHIAAGERFVLRLRYGYADEKHGEIKPHVDLEVGKGIRAVVAKYEIVDQNFKTTDGEIETRRAYRIIPNSTIMDFTERFTASDNYIEGGIFDNDKHSYIIENVAQTPSTKYCYKIEGDDTEYVWDGEQNKYIPKPDNYLSYYHTTATAQTSVSTETLSDPSTNIGIFLYTTDDNLINKYIYIEDIQLTRYYEDDKGHIVTLGNVPESKSIETRYYYLKPTNSTQGEATNIYSSLPYLARENGLAADDIKPVYNDHCEKVLSIEETQSNCFNILQSLCETFECWLKIDVEHKEDGSIVLNDDFQPIKKISFKEFIGKDNFAGFKYGINLNSISRTIDSNEIVTKLIVDNVSSEYTESGSLSIQDASSNPSKESYILNFSHYINTKIIQDKDKCNEDVNEFNRQLAETNQEIYNLQKEKVKLENAINVSKANTNTLELTVKEAQTMYNEALTRFELATKMSYSSYVEKYNTDPTSVADLLENDDIIALIGEIYTAAITINNYSGIVTNLKQEYNRLYFQLYGAKEYGISITTTSTPIGEALYTYITNVIIDDYLDGLDFILVSPALESGEEQKYEKHFSSNLNEKHFTASLENGRPFLQCIFKKLPDHYKLQYYKDGEAYISGKKEDIIFDIYSSDSHDSLTKRFKLIPEEDWSDTYPNLDKSIDEKTKEKKQIEKDFYEKYSHFIQEGTWSSSDYIDPELYYLDAQQVSRTSAQPKVTYEIEVSEISELEGYGNYYFVAGDKTYIEDENFFGSITTVVDGKHFITPIKEEVVISEVEWHLDEPETNKITVQNYKTQFEDLFQRISATVQTVQYNEVAYPKTSSIIGTNGLLDADLLLKSWNNSVGSGYNLTSDGTVVTDSNGILVKDLTNSANLVRIESRGIKISSDGGQTWLAALNGRGINADVLNAGTINTQQVWLMDGDNPSFRWDKAGISAYGFDQKEEEPYDLKTYVRFDKYGIYGIQNGENYVASSLQDIKDTAKFGLTWKGFFIKNSYTDGYVSISSDDDFQIVTVNEEQDFYMPVYNIQDIQLDSFQKTILFPYSNRSIVRIYKREETKDILVTEYTFEDETITIVKVGEEAAADGTYRIEYVELLNSIDLGGKGIIEINSIMLNDGLYTKDYTYNKENGLLTFSEELLPGDHVVINYKLERIKIGATNFVDGAPTKYGIEVRNNIGETVFETNDEGNLSVTGTINATDGVFRGSVYATDGEFTGYIRATSGEFPGSVTVGDEDDNYIAISGEQGQPFIASGSYLNNEDEGWIISGDGDAIFNNVSVRGAIRTSVFEKGEIQAVGGMFLFRPSDIIEQGALQIVEIDGQERADLVLTMKQKGSFQVGDLCQLGEISSVEGSLKMIYEIIEVSDDGKTIVLAGAGEIFRDGN